MTKQAGEGLFPCQSELIALINTLSDVIFCAKDLDGRYVEVNAAFVRRTGRRSKREVVGARATDLFPAAMAERYENQDRIVFETGQPVRDELELILRTDGTPGWYLSTKLPVSESDIPGQLAGLVSVSRDLRAPSERNIALADLQKVVTLVAEQLGSRISVADMAAAAGCSPAQLESRMKRVFGLTATQYVLRVRVQRATELLVESSAPIADVGLGCGFYDQPDFTRRFARLTNYTPAEFRKLRTGS